MTEDVQTLFERAGCSGQLCVQSLDGTREITVGADRPAVPASVIKVLIALVAEARFEDRTIDPTERTLLSAADPVPGPVGFSLYQDDIEVSLRDLVVPMLTISDNVATDALLHRLGTDAVNAYGEQLGLTNTIITSDIRTLIDSIGQDAGFAGWNAMVNGIAAAQDDKAEIDRIDACVFASGALDPARGHRTTARDMTALLRLIWTGEAGPPKACARLRQVMGLQLTKNRLASGFRPPVRVAAKSGGLAGFVRNEVGVIEYPDGDVYIAAVFTQSKDGDNSTINAVIGQAAAAAVAQLRSRAS